ncbi:MAG: ATP-binding protein [Verrucomicrobiae bacterium]|nr:ATP-binding protein [Verrucomicrobiae bacterium]
MFHQAKRSSAKLRLALCGPSGSGKTYSALRIAQGLGGRIALIDTERGSGELYSDLCAYDVAQLNPPFTPARYIEAIRAAEKAKYDIVIIDSLSHAWSGPGGVLEMQDQAAKALKNGFAAWREITPEHNKLVDKLLQTDLHIIVTMRTKTAYEVQQESGKTKVVKVGLAPVQREGLEYEFTVVLDLSVDGHIATGTKDRTGLFDGQHFVATEETGQRLSRWLRGSKADVLDISPDRADLVLRSLSGLGLADLGGTYEDYVCRKYGLETLGEMKSDQIKEQLAILAQCRERPGRKKQFEEMLRGKRSA